VGQVIARAAIELHPFAGFLVQPLGGCGQPSAGKAQRSYRTGYAAHGDHPADIRAIGGAGHSAPLGLVVVLVASRALIAPASGPAVIRPREGEEPMAHKFKVGEIVSLRPAISRNVPGGIFEVVKQLPPPGSHDPEYRIKSANEPHERVARESELMKI
jgi:hypothetical protein